MKFICNSKPSCRQVFALFSYNNEIIEFCEDKHDSYNYYIQYYGCYNPKLSHYTGFSFASIEDFKLFVSYLDLFVHSETLFEDNYTFNDKYLEDKKHKQFLDVYSSGYSFEIKLYKKKKKEKNCVWKVIIDKQYAKQLFDELETWLRI